MTYTPSLFSRASFQSHGTEISGGVGVVADTRVESDLPEIERELQSISEQFNNDVRNVYKGFDATIANARKIMGKRGISFFACHGENDWDAPLDGHLKLSDGLLTGRDLLDEHIISDVVIMSACYSGLADRSPGPSDDLFGIERIILSQGTRAVVSGLWQVDDLRGAKVTSELVTGIAAGKPLGKALNDAQRVVLHEYRSKGDERLRFFTHPHFWAVFRVLGNESLRYTGQNIVEERNQ